METRPVNGHFLSVGVVLVTLLPHSFGQEENAAAVIEIAQHYPPAHGTELLLPQLFFLPKFPGSNIPMYDPEMAV